ncbi:MAG: HAD-IIB family hydrolase [Nanoarchaeota archaeon]|nr:HAD-IIB family hydrolase [Nanoarchaeota archaeon]
MVNMIKALVFDVDDTITASCQTIKDETANILEKIRPEIAFLTGTPIPELKRMISSRLNRKHHLMGNTGTHYVVVENSAEKEILKDSLNEEEKIEIIIALKQLKAKYNLIPLTSEEDQIQDRGSQITFSVLGRNASSKDKSNYDSDKKKRIEFIFFLNNIINKYEIKIGGTTSIDITPKGRDKAWAINNFMRINNFRKDEIIFFGDQLQPGGNDYAALKTGVKCVAVKNPEQTIEILKEMLDKKEI